MKWRSRNNQLRCNQGLVERKVKLIWDLEEKQNNSRYEFSLFDLR